MEDPARLFIAVRADLPPAIAGVQACHAVAKAVSGRHLPDNTHFVLVQVPSKEELLSLAKKLYDDGSEFELFFEPDYDLGETALATPPGDRKKGKRFSKYPLWKGV